MAPTAQAKRIAKAATSGVHTHRSTKIRTSVHFYRPKTKSQQRRPLFPKVSVRKPTDASAFDILRFPVSTEHAIAEAEQNNTLTFFVARNANKHSIRLAFQRVYGTRPVKVNTLITPLCTKKAYIRLPASVSAANFATKHKLQ